MTHGSMLSCMICILMSTNTKLFLLYTFLAVLKLPTRILVQIVLKKQTPKKWQTQSEKKYETSWYSLSDTLAYPLLGKQPDWGGGGRGFTTKGSEFILGSVFRYMHDEEIINLINKKKNLLLLSLSNIFSVFDFHLLIASCTILQLWASLTRL